MKKTLSIIIVNYRSEQFLGACLTSLYKSYANDDMEVIVFNNDAAETLLAIKEKFPNIKILGQQKNIGFGAAHNRAIRETAGEYLFLLNPDTEILSGIEKALQLFKQDQKIGIIGANLLSETGTTQPWIAGVSVNLLDLIKNNLGLVASRKVWESKKTILTDWVSGGAMFVRRNVFAELDGFDENFFMYFEDIDFCKRAQEIGVKIAYCPDIKINHLGGGSFESKKIQKTEYYKSQDYYFKKHFGETKARTLRLIRKICCLN